VKHSQKRGRTWLKIVEGYRIDGKVKQRRIKDHWYIDQLQDTYDDLIIHFKTVAKLTTEYKKSQ